MARNDPQLNLRLSPELKSKLAESAIANNRSLTSEVAIRLERSFESKSELSEVDINRIADALALRIKL